MSDTEQTEVWASATGGAVWVQTKDPTHPNTYRPTKIGGKTNRKVQLTISERRFNQELIPVDQQELDPFTNGLLVRTSPSPSGTSDSDLVKILRVEDDADFENGVKAIDKEVVLRRMIDLAESHTTYQRHQFITELVRDRYHVGKTQRSVKEMYEEDPASFGGIEL